MTHMSPTKAQIDSVLLVVYRNDYPNYQRHIEIILDYSCHMLSRQRCQKPVAKAISPEHKDKYHLHTDAIAF